MPLDPLGGLTAPPIPPSWAGPYGPILTLLAILDFGAPSAFTVPSDRFLILSQHASEDGNELLNMWNTSRNIMGEEKHYIYTRSAIDQSNLHDIPSDMILRNKKKH